MRCFVSLLSVIVATVCLYSSCCGTEFEEDLEDEDKWPTISIVILVKNKAVSLPYSLTCLQQLDYPKDRLNVWFHVNDYGDESLAIIQMWSKKYENEYFRIEVHNETKHDKAAAVDKDSMEWTEEHFMCLISLKEKALNRARNIWTDYIFMLDADAFVVDPKTLKKLVRKKRPIVAPLLISDGAYANFWDGMAKNYQFETTERYGKIFDRQIKGCFKVPMVHSAVLINMRMKKSDLLTFNPAKLKNYRGPIDDIIAFAVSASSNDIPMAICNDRLYGFVPVPFDQNVDLGIDESELLLNLKLEALSRGMPIPLNSEFSGLVRYPKKDRLGLNRVYMINLERRLERRNLMNLSFKELGIDAITIQAIDGLKLNMQNLAQYGVTLMPKYEDPYSKRPMKAGEVGCFLSHYLIWKEIAQLHLEKSLVLEDDIRFTPFFRRHFEVLLKELESLDWDLVYVGRKILQDGEVPVGTHLVKPLYSYWSLGYLISEAGARKLIQAEPLAKMLPVDEFLPIMFDQHPNDTWKSFFPRRELKAFSASPLLVYPTHYTGEEGYVSDTENSVVLPSRASDGRKSADTL